MPKMPMKILSLIMLALAFVAPSAALGQELRSDTQEIFKARVIYIAEEQADARIQGIGPSRTTQVLEAEALSGESKGMVIKLSNDFVPVGVGDVVYVSRIVTASNQELYALLEPVRTVGLSVLAALFIGAILLLSGKQGLRSLASLVASLAIIFLLYIPLLLEGVSPVPLSVAVAVAILAVSIYTTHGWKRTTHAAFLGTSIAASLTGLLGSLAVSGLKLSGYSSDEAVYLNVATSGALNLSGLLLGAFIIGILGILDDVAITQAAAVDELKSADRTLSRRELFTRAIRIGRDHVGALVNTLALAYTGAALPLLLLFYGTSQDLSLILNREVFATEIIRTLVGSIGLIMAVPITTLLAVYLVRGERHGSAHHH
jgi:uncharacterized membrane protein